MSQLFDRLFEQSERRPPTARPSRREVASRILFGAIGLALYGGIILLAFHSPTLGDNTRSSTAPFPVLLILFLVWVLANAMLVSNGNVFISVAACVAFWWLAFELCQPHRTGIDAALAREDDSLDLYVIIPLLGFVNLLFLLVSHAILRIPVPQREEEPAGPSQSQP